MRRGGGEWGEEREVVAEVYRMTEKATTAMKLGRFEMGQKDVHSTYKKKQPTYFGASVTGVKIIGCVGTMDCAH